jgi:hypothetical protein
MTYSDPSLFLPVEYFLAGIAVLATQQRMLALAISESLLFSVANR